MNMSKIARLAIVCTCIVFAGGCKSTEHVTASSSSHSLIGAWRSSVQFESGDFAAVKDLRFLYVFHADGTMTESSNYDGAPPVPPAYGVWRRLATNEYETRYIFFTTAPPATFEDLKRSGWMPSGYGVLLERIVVDPDGQFFDSIMRLDMYDNAGKSIGQPSLAHSRGERFTFAPAPASQPVKGSAR